MKRKVMAISVATIGLVAITGAGVVRSPASSTQACSTHGSVGTSSTSLTLPKHSKAVRYFVTVSADQVANPAYPQNISLQGTLAPGLSDTMNLAQYDDDTYGGVIGFWDSLNHIPAEAPASTLTAEAQNSGGQIRLTVQACTES
jgi:hypothetical protein